MGKPV